jgi:AcrR family transcriptional regulator
VLNAADDLLAERGFAGLTIEGIATRAGVAKQTIYRWWPSKVDILIEAFRTDVGEELHPPDHGDLGQDLRAYLPRLGHFLTETDPGAVFRALAGQAQHDQQVAGRFRAECLERQRWIDRIPLDNAVKRGQLPADIDVEFAVDQLYGPLYYRVLISGSPLPAEFLEQLIGQFLGYHRNT